MIEFIDKTSTRSGTRINRANLMALQGFVAKTITINSDGSITEKNANGETLTTTFKSNGTIVEKFVGSKTITKTTTINTNGTISVAIS